MTELCLIIRGEEKNSVETKGAEISAAARRPGAPSHSQNSRAGFPAASGRTAAGLPARETESRPQQRRGDQRGLDAAQKPAWLERPPSVVSVACVTLPWHPGLLPHLRVLAEFESQGALKSQAGGGVGIGRGLWAATGSFECH